MKTFFKPLLLAFTVSFAAFSASFADGNPTRPTAAAAFKTGIYTTIEGKLNVSLDKEVGGAVAIQLKAADGKVLYTQHLSKKQQTVRVCLNLNELEDGAYRLEITNGVETTTHSVTLSTQQPSALSRQISIN